MRLALHALLIGLVGACAARPAAQPAPQAPKAAGAAAPSTDTAGPSPAAPSAGAVRELPELRPELEAERVTGTIALYDSKDAVLGCSDAQLCRESVSPASTFEIPHSMIALETGGIDGPDSMLKWDRQAYSNPDWNQDLSFRDAFRLSCVPCYRDIARRVGRAGEQEWLNKLDYGNRDTSGDEKFWLAGGLRISPIEQLAFLRRFDADQLPISSRTADMVRDIMTVDVTENYVLRGKTASARPPEQERELGWFVGWLELGARRIFFATLLTGHAPGVDPLPARRRVTERVLRARGLM